MFRLRLCCGPMWLVMAGFSFHCFDVSSSSEKGTWSQRDKRRSPWFAWALFLLLPVHFQSNNSFVTYIRERRRSIIREPVLLCVSLMRPVLSASLPFALLPFETAATWCYNTLPAARGVFFPGLLFCLCVTWLSLGPLHLFKLRPDIDTVSFMNEPQSSSVKV